jgi:peptidoglycan-associated lipoprotein
MSKVAAIALAGIGLADLLCIDAWLLPAVVASEPHARASMSMGMASAGLVALPEDLRRSPAPAGAAALPQPSAPSAATVTSQRPPEVLEAEPTIVADAGREPAVPAAAPKPIAAASPATPPPPIYFAHTGEAEVDASGQLALEGLAEQLRDDGALAVSVRGHADARGSRRINHRLSQRRAQAVARVLEREGIASRRIDVAWFGEARPAQRGVGDQAWAANRRVEVRIHRSE